MFSKILNFLVVVYTFVICPTFIVFCLVYAANTEKECQRRCGDKYVVDCRHTGDNLVVFCDTNVVRK